MKTLFLTKGLTLKVKKLRSLNQEVKAQKCLPLKVLVSQQQNKAKQKTKKLVKSLENCRKRWKSHKTYQKLSKISDENPNN